MTSATLESPTTSGATGRIAATGARRWLALPVILTGTFMVILDFFIVNVTLPSMQRELHAGSAAIQFVVAGYGLTYAVGLITGGRLGDLYGRRRLFAVGLALFILTSAGCGLAPTAMALVLARVLQGVAAALLAPQALAMLSVVYTGEDRTRAFTAYGLTLGLAAVLGQLIGGLLIRADVAGLGWRACFLINLPIGIAALILTPRLVPESRAEGRERLDLVGAALVTLGLVAVVLPLVEGRAQGWPLWSWLCLVTTLPLLLTFVGYQRWLGACGRTPLIDLTLFGERAFTVGILAILVFYAGVASFFLVLALYLQQGRGLDALASGVVFTPEGIGFLMTSMSARWLTRRLGWQALAVGALVLAVGFALLRAIVTHVGVTGHADVLAPALFLVGVGMGMVIAPLFSVVLAGIAPRHAGAAAGLLTAASQVANALGVAIIGIIFYGVLGRSSGRDAYPNAFDASLIYLTALAVAVAVLIQLLPRDPGRG